MTIRFAILVPALLLGSPICLPAQLTTITQAGSGETVRTTTHQLRSLARTSDGRLWSIVHRNDGKNQGAKSQFLELWASRDNGATWSKATTTRTTGSIRGSLRTGVDGRTMHAVWRATNGAAASGIWYATYDTVKGVWNGTDFEVAKGVNANNQFLSPTVEVTKGGTVVLCYYTHRQGPWAGITRVLKGTTWSPPTRVNVDTYGVVIDHQAHGEDIHYAYRTNQGGYGIRYRRLDTTTMKFGAEGEIQVSQANTKLTDPASSGNNICVLANGDTYVIYASGKNATAGSGAIWVSYAKAGSYKFTTHTKVADDAPLKGGNSTYHSYSIMRAADRAHVVYSLATEQNAKLYMRILLGTNGASPQIPINVATANAFTWVVGHRNTSGLHGMMATIYDSRHAGGRASFYGTLSTGATVFHGNGCSGRNMPAPWLGTAALPALGQTLDLTLVDLPRTQPGLMFFGINDRMLGAIPLPLALDFIGLTGCLLWQDFLVTGGFASDGSGNGLVKFPIPNLPFLRGLPLFFQAYVVAPTANAGNALMTNGVAAIPR